MLPLPPELLSGFLQEYYARDVILPDQLLLPIELEDSLLLADWLSEKRGRKVNLLTPQRGEKKRLCLLAQRNAPLANDGKAGLYSRSIEQVLRLE